MNDPDTNSVIAEKVVSTKPDHWIWATLKRIGVSLAAAFLFGELGFRIGLGVGVIVGLLIGLVMKQFEIMLMSTLWGIGIGIGSGAVFGLVAGLISPSFIDRLATRFPSLTREWPSSNQNQT